MMLYICIMFHENISKGFIVIEGLVFPYSGFSKGHNSVKNIRRVMSLFSAYLLMMFLFVQSFMNISKGFLRLIQWTRFPIFKFSKGNNSITKCW